MAQGIGDARHTGVRAIKGHGGRGRRRRARHPGDAGRVAHVVVAVVRGHVAQRVGGRLEQVIGIIGVTELLLLWRVAIDDLQGLVAGGGIELHVALVAVRVGEIGLQYEGRVAVVAIRASAEQYDIGFASSAAARSSRVEDWPLGSVAGYPVNLIGAAVGLGLLDHVAGVVIQVVEIGDALGILNCEQQRRVVVGIAGHPAVGVGDANQPPAAVVGILHCATAVIGGAGDAMGGIVLEVNRAPIGRGNTEQIAKGGGVRGVFRHPIEQNLVAVLVGNADQGLAGGTHKVVGVGEAIVGPIPSEKLPSPWESCPRRCPAYGRSVP